ncbi:MAG: hypothetical protein JW993_13790 [Sedimentisphaerales bacterium]|nr:hypothetical protein [Sedimentisphaerales bacterium]
MTTRYTLMLVNSKDKTLDLTAKGAAIMEVLRRLETGDRTDRRSRHLSRCSIHRIDPRCVEIDVDEICDRWHPCVGSMLANEYGMRHYCDGHRLFKWNRN